MAITTREELVKAISLLGVIGTARTGELDEMIAGSSLSPQTVYEAVANKHLVSILEPFTGPDFATAPMVAVTIFDIIEALQAKETV